MTPTSNNEPPSGEEEDMAKAKRQYIILCGGSHGRAIICGYTQGDPTPGEPVELTKARMILYWDSACGGLFGLAATGPKGGTRITAEIPRVVDTDWKQWLAVKTPAAKAIRDWPVTG